MKNVLAKVIILAFIVVPANCFAVGDMAMEEQSYCVVGPRWAGISNIVKQGAHLLKLDIEIDSEKRFLKETTCFTVSGDRERLEAFERALNEAIEEFNKRQSSIFQTSTKPGSIRKRKML